MRMRGWAKAFGAVGLGLLAVATFAVTPTGQLSLPRAWPMSSAALAESVNSFLNVDGIAGESADARHLNQIDLLGWSFGVSQTPPPVGGGGSAGKVVCSGLALDKRFDKSSPPLTRALVTGTHIRTAVLTVARTSGTADFLTFTFSDLVLSSYQATGEGAPPVDTFHILFGTLEVAYTPQKVDGTPGQTQRATISCTGGGGGAPPDPAVTGTAKTILATEGTAFSGVVASFTDPDASAVAADFLAHVCWDSDPTHCDGGTVTATGPGVFDVTGSHTYAEEGAYSISVTVTPLDGEPAPADAAQVQSGASVADASLTPTPHAISSTEGASFSGVVASLSDADPNGVVADYTVTINWGDGTTSGGSVAATSSGDFDITGIHTYAEEGSYSVAVAFADAGGSTGSTVSQAVVSDAGLAATGRSLSVDVKDSFTNIVANFTDSDPAGTPSDYTARIDWGDSTASTGIVRVNGHGGFRVSGTHRYKKKGTYSLTIVVSDAGGSTATAHSRITASNNANNGG